MTQAPLVLHVFPGFAVGGAQMRFAALANHFGPAFRHMVVALDGNLGCRERLDPGLDIAFPAVAAPKHAMLANAWRFRGLLRRWRPDVLVTCNWGAIEFAMANVPPIARHLHVVDGFGPDERDRRMRRRILVRRLVLGRSKVVVPSRTLERIATESWQLPARVVQYVPNGIDVARFSPRGPRLAPQSGTAVASGVPAAPWPQPDRGRDPPVIGTVAALRPEKNLARLIRAFARVVHEHAPARLIIVGDGPEHAPLNALAADLGVAGLIRFTGHRDDTAALYPGFDVFALTSDTEQMPLAVIEAMASGLPVVATDVGDLRLMLAPDNLAFLCPCEDDAFACRLAAMLACPARRAQLGLANRAKAERAFDQAAMFAAWHGLWTATA